MHKNIQFDSPIGKITAFCTENGISRIHIGALPAAIPIELTGNELLDRCRLQVNEYFAGQRKAFDLPLDWSSLKGFQSDVLRITLEIPYGEVLTYGDIAKRLGKPAASRAVGGALAQTGDYLLFPIKSAIRKYSLNLVGNDTAVKISKLGDTAGVIGACMLARSKMLSLI